MTSQTIFYRVKRGDSLSRISQMTGIPYHALITMENVPNPDMIFEGDQILWQDGVANYTHYSEAIYYEIINFSIEEPVLTLGDSVALTQKEAYYAAITALYEEKMAELPPEEDDYQPILNGDNNVGCSDGTCELEERCLLEVSLMPKGVYNQASDGNVFKYIWPYPDPNKQEKAIPPYMVFTEMEGLIPSVSYEVKGDCLYKHPACVTVFLKTLEAYPGKTTMVYMNKIEEKELTGEITQLTFNPQHAIPISLNAKGVLIIPKNFISKTQPVAEKALRSLLDVIHLNPSKPSHNIITFVLHHSMNVLFKSELNDFPGNVLTLAVRECYEGMSLTDESIGIRFVVLPNYKQTFAVTIGLAFTDNVPTDAEGRYPSLLLEALIGKALYADKYNRKKLKLDFKGTYTVEVGNFTIELNTPTVETPPFIDKVCDFIATGKRLNFKGFPVAFNVIPPVLTFEGSAELKSSANGGAIARAGIVKLDPLIGFQLSVDLLEVAGNILKGVAPPFGAVGGFLLDAANEFERVRHLTSEKEKLKLIEGPKSRNKFRVAAYCYLAVRVDIGGGYKFADTDLFDEENVLEITEQSTAEMAEKAPGENDGEAVGKAPKSGPGAYFSAEAIAGGYAGLWAEARLWGIGFGAGATAGLEVKCHAKFYVRSGQLNAWFGGIILTVQAKYTGKEKRDENNEEVSMGDITVRGKSNSGRNEVGYIQDNGDGTCTWTGQIVPPGKESEAFFSHNFYS